MTDPRARAPAVWAIRQVERRAGRPHGDGRLVLVAIRYNLRRELAFGMEVKRLLELRLRQLERTLRGKEERIVQLETENALLHLKLAKCRGSVKDSKEETTCLRRHLEDVRNIQKNTGCQLSQLFAGVKKTTHLRKKGNVYRFSRSLLANPEK
ncbi:hypothetical protein scyTo_0016445 [Scyliorhinus torazame]|uniref:Uncharacterized protein n=1 Tax=Scyliorhinus torazame TaxID=75743 RepID=A0A401PR42_SCYTO|nr:hypothetical protein [Scyliorhinus torazame]